MTRRTWASLNSDRSEVILRRLAGSSALSAAEQALILTLDGRSEHHRSGEELLCEGEPVRGPRFIVSGWASNQRVLTDGRRQVFGFALPGDCLGGHPRTGEPAPFTVVATTPVETLDAAPLLEAGRSGTSPGLEWAFSAGARFQEKLLLDQTVRLGRQTAYERIAHFLLELYDRLETVGLAQQQRFPLPLTQEVLGDTLGLSIVHINRTLQQMRRERLIEWRSGVATILRRDLMVSIADYQRAA